MKNATEHAKLLRTLLRKVKPSVTVPETAPMDPLHAMIFGFLNWECSRNQAESAFARLMAAMVDINELRVSDPGELVDLIGADYNRAQERCLRMTQSLHAVYRHEHAVDLSSATDMSKRDARAFLEKLDGMVPFVAAYVVLFALNGHAIPLDQQLFERLKNDGVLDPDATKDEAQAFLEHQIRADGAIEAYYQLRAYVERPIRVDLGGKSRSKTTKASTKKAHTKKTTKRTTKRTTKKKAPTRRRAASR